MTQIEDVSPKWSNTTITLDPTLQSVQGRMLSLACSADGQRVYTGTYSGVWRSDDQGRTFRQMVRPQPDPAQFDVSGELGGWEVFDLAVSPNDPDLLIAVTRYDLRVTGLHGIYRSSDGGESWALVHQFPELPTKAGQILWSADDGTLVVVAWGTSIAISQDAGASFNDFTPWAPGGGSAYHIAIGHNPDGSVSIFALGDSQLWFTSNRGASWALFPQPVPAPAGGPDSEALGNCPSVMVVPQSQPGTTYVVAHDGTLWFQDFASPAPSWIQLSTPNLAGGEGDSGNRFLAVSGSRANPLLFYCATSRLYVAPAPPTSSDDWQRLDDDHNVHLDLHGVLLSPDFDAVFSSGGYQATAGMLWLLSDGGLHWSTDGGRNFVASSGLSTLATTNIAGLSIAGKTALCLNCGDNGGFYSVDGGQTWKTLTYEGGDNDCAFADPLQPDRMLVFAPRSGDNGGVLVYVGNLPDGTGDTGYSYLVEGPPAPTPRNSFTGTGTSNWSAISKHAMRGYRPIVHSIFGEDGVSAGDYIFIRYKTDSTAVLLRTKASVQIDSGNEFDTDARTEQSGGNVYQVGPVLPANDIDIVQAAGGHGNTVFYVGGDSLMRLWKWTDGMSGWRLLLEGSSGVNLNSVARRFFVDPYRPEILFAASSQNVIRSEDGGATWAPDANLEQQLTNNGDLPVALDTGGELYYDTVLNDMKFDPEDAQRRYAVGAAGVFFTVDGVNWHRLLDATAFPGRPGSCYYDFVSDPCRRSLYVGLSPRGVVKISPLPFGALQAPDLGSWSENQKIPDKNSKERATIAVFQNMLHMVYLDSSSNDMWHSVSADGVNWSNSEKVPIQSTQTSVALAEFQGKLHMVHLGNGSNQLYWSMFDGVSWKDSQGNEGDEKLGTQHSQATPALAVYGNRLHMVHMGDSSNDIWWSMFDGISWKDSNGSPGDQRIKSQLSQSPPALAVFNNELHMVHIGDSSNDIWWSAYDGNAWWSNRRIRCQFAQQTPRLAAQGGRLHMVHMGDSSNTIWWSIYDGSEWTPDQLIPNQLSQNTPELSPLPDGSRLLMVHLGDSEDDMWESVA
jgi:photosystem II stability/assembly factor-like uncharacterized protein